MLRIIKQFGILLKTPLLQNLLLLVLLTNFDCTPSFAKEIADTSGNIGTIVQFQHDACELEFHNKFLFEKFHELNPFRNENGGIELLVRFRGTADGHIGLTVNPNDSEPLYMIIIGSYNNRVSEIRRTKRAVSQIRINTLGILSPDTWKGFIIRYNPNNGQLSVSPEGSELVLLYWQDPTPLEVKYFSFTTYHGRILQVAFDCRAKDEHSSVPKRIGSALIGASKQYLLNEIPRIPYNGLVRDFRHIHLLQFFDLT